MRCTDQARWRRVSWSAHVVQINVAPANTLMFIAHERSRQPFANVIIVCIYVVQDFPIVVCIFSRFFFISLRDKRVYAYTYTRMQCSFVCKVCNRGEKIVIYCIHQRIKNYLISSLGDNLTSGLQSAREETQTYFIKCTISRIKRSHVRIFY